MTTQEGLLVLNAIPGMSGVVVSKLLSHFGCADEVFSQQHEDLLRFGLSQNLSTNILHFPRDQFLKNEYLLMNQMGVSFLTIDCEEYPIELKGIEYAPIVLYIKGDSKKLSLPSVAMVGSRKASPYGLKVADDFAVNFAKSGLSVVSGGALGIDTASHQGTLRAGGQTIAVLGCGLNHIYPRENKGLFNQIAQEGVLVSEFPMNTAPFAYNFHRRNRIISGLSLATMVVEAALKSGSLITVDFALAQQREIFVVPGNIDNLYSQGTNKLIKDGAKIVLSANDVLEELGIAIKVQLEQEVKKEKIHIPLSVEEYTIYELIGEQSCHIDEISLNSGQDISLLMGQMLNLELKGVIKQLPGQYYVRI